MSRWRTRIGEEGVETLLMATLAAAHKLGALKPTSVDRVIVDTTVMPKAIVHPADSRLLERSRQHLVALAKAEGLTLRQNYNREAGSRSATAPAAKPSLKNPALARTDSSPKPFTVNQNGFPRAAL